MYNDHYLRELRDKSLQQKWLQACARRYEGVLCGSEYYALADAEKAKEVRLQVSI